VDEDSDDRNPAGPKAVPGIYTLRFTVDGKTYSQQLKVIMDLRSPATPQTPQQQLQLGREIFAETLEARRALAEIASVQKQLAEAEQKIGEKTPDLKSALAEAQAEIAKIVSNKETPQEPVGLHDAYTELASALRVVESGDRAVPSQAIAVYQDSSPQVKTGIARWNTFKQTKLPELNQKLREESIAPIAISQIEQEVRFLMSR
jgi:hypothetical protein